VPQIFNAQRFNCRLDHVPQVMRVFDACMQLDAFETHPARACPDAELIRVSAAADAIRPDWPAPPGTTALMSTRRAASARRRSTA
jgi:hypothetical protein